MSRTIPKNLPFKAKQNPKYQRNATHVKNGKGKKKGEASMEVKWREPGGWRETVVRKLLRSCEKMWCEKSIDHAGATYFNDGQCTKSKRTKSIRTRVGGGKQSCLLTLMQTYSVTKRLHTPRRHTTMTDRQPTKDRNVEERINAILWF